jgi:prevent-host-death family protein
MSTIAIKATIKTMGSREAQSHFGKLLDTARREPVLVERHGRGVAVVLSSEDYFDFLAEDAYWGERALEARTRGHLSEKKSEALLASLHHAPD